MTSIWRVAVTLVSGLTFASGCSRGRQSAPPVASNQVEPDRNAISVDAPRGFAAESIVAANYSEAMERIARAEAEGNLPEPPGDDATLNDLRRFGAVWQERWGPSFEVKLVGARPLIEPGHPAPPWTLRNLDGEPVSRDDYAGRHVLMVWGSLSCPTTCVHVTAFEELARKWTDAGLACVFVYEREAHAGGQFGYGVVRQAFVFDDRVHFARRLAALFGLNQTIFIDDMSGSTKQAYAAQDNSAYLLDSAGRIVLSQVFFEPEEVERELAVRLGSPAAEDCVKRRDERSSEPEGQ